MLECLSTLCTTTGAAEVCPVDGDHQEAGRGEKKGGFPALCYDPKGCGRPSQEGHHCPGDLSGNRQTLEHVELHGCKPTGFLSKTSEKSFVIWCIFVVAIRANEPCNDSGFILKIYCIFHKEHAIT